MSNYESGIDQAVFCKLTGVAPEEIAGFCRDDYPLLPGCYLANEIALGKRLHYSDALAIELARQVSADWSISMEEALRIASYAGAVEGFMASAPRNIHRKFLSDFWFAVIAFDASSDGEFSDDRRFKGHYAGTWHEATGQIAARFQEEESEEGTTPFRVLLINVSAADRRLIARAKKLDIGID
jgi:hypothetical protein